MKNVDKSQQKSLNKRFLLVFGLLMILAYTVLGAMFIFYEPMRFIIEDQAFRRIVGVCIIIYAIFRFSRLRYTYLDDEREQNQKNN